MRDALRQWPLTVILGWICVAMAFVWGDRFRVGSVLLAAAVVLAFILRTVLTDDGAGWLAVRSRGVDMMVLGVLAGALTVLSLWVPPPA